MECGYRISEKVIRVARVAWISVETDSQDDYHLILVLERAGGSHV